MKSTTLHWLCPLSALSLPVLLWLGQVISRWDRAPQVPAAGPKGGLWGYVRIRPDRVEQVTPFKPYAVMDFTVCMHGTVAGIVLVLALRTVPPYERIKSGAYLSTGFFTMILAMEMCERIQVYGMINADYCRRSNRRAALYHYYDRAAADECLMYKAHERKQRGGHRFITEKVIYAKWAARHKMEFTHPSWNL